MNIFKKAYCRLVQKVFYLAMPFLPYRLPRILSDGEEVAKVLSNLQLKSVLLVTTKGMRQRGTTAPLEAALKRAGIALAVYDGVCPNPTKANVEEGLALYKEAKCQGLIAFGGGSPMDCAKGIAALAVRPKKSLNDLSGLLKVRRKIPPFVAVPTTAGSGSEVTLAAVLTDSEQKHKYVISDFCLIPHYAVLDPRVTVTLPPSLTAATGMDALTHAVEAYIGQSTTSLTEKMAKEAVAAIFTHLEQAVKQGDDLVAREALLWASYKAGVAFTRSYVGYVHAIAHSLGGEYDLPHGQLNAVLLPHVLESYGRAAEKKLYALALFLGIAEKGDSPGEGAKKFISAIRNLNRRLHIPETVPELCPDDIPRLSAHAEKEANPLYPVPKLMDRRELAEIYRKVLAQPE